ncbi:MAG: hypothetical protein HYZ16_01280 [Bacteroidetes bacterium]|jgi:hypothetical protein|nr:hypothetical protein [Bacteroidota bacterium]
MIRVNPQFITDSFGKKLSVVLPMSVYEAILEELEELEDVRLYDEGKKDQRPSMPIDDAFRLIEANRKTGDGI